VHHNCGLNADRAMVLAGVIAKVPQVSHFRLFGNLTLLARFLVRFVDAFIFNSKAVCASYTRLGIPAEKGHVVYNPIDSAAFAQDTGGAELRKELGLSQEDCVVSNVGRIVEWKGQDRFLRAMAEVVKTYPNTRVLIVGEPGPAHREQLYDQELRQLSEDLGLSSRVVFTGLRSDISRIMAASDVVVHSAVKPEPFGRVIAEALMAGRPVVATAGGGVPEIIDDGVTGLLVPPGDVNSMAEAIRYLLSDLEKAGAMGMRARQEALERFTVERHVQQIEKIYAGIVSRCSTLA
jgi:glycosyltransferase involved in cell wall biosynthesis